MRALAATGLVAVLALLAWWWASGGAARRAGRAIGEGPGEPAAAAREEPAEAVAEPVAPPVADLAALTVRILDEDGAAVAGAWVEVRRDERHEVLSRAFADGLGRATVQLTRDDMLFVGARGFMQARVSGALRRRVTEVVLRRGGYDIAGVVVDGAGRGIAGAALVLDPPFLPERTGVSGPGGRFAFEGVSEHEMQLRAQADGYVGGGGTVAPGDADVRIVLFRPMTASGVVVFPDGSPAKGARIGQVAADESGRFTLRDVVPGRFEVAASLEAGGRRWTAHSVVEVGEDGAHAPIRLVLEPRPRSWVPVRVLEADGSPSGGVMLRSPLIQGSLPWTTADGRTICAFDVPAGTQTWVEVAEIRRRDGLLPGRAIVTTGARDAPEVILRPREPVVVTVVVRGQGGAALPPGVAARIDAYGNPVVRRERDAAVVAVDPLAAEFSVTVSAGGFGQKFERLPLPPDGRVEIRLNRTGEVMCRVADEAGAIVENAVIQARVPGGGSVATTDPGPDGTFRLDGVPAGRAVVTAGHDDDLPLVKVEADVCAGEVTDLGTLVLRPPRTLSGRVTGPTGRPIGGAKVYAVGDRSETSVYSRSDGAFRLEVPPWFDGYVLATKPGCGTVHHRARESLALVLDQEGQVRLELRLPPTGGASRGWSLAARDPSTGFTWHLRDWQRVEGTTYLVPGLPPGRLILVLQTLPRDAETEVVVVAGRTISAVIEVPE